MWRGFAVAKRLVLVTRRQVHPCAHSERQRRIRRMAPLEVEPGVSESLRRSVGCRAAYMEPCRTNDEVEIVERAVGQLWPEFGYRRAAIARPRETELELELSRALRSGVFSQDRVRGENGRRRCDP